MKTLSCIKTKNRKVRSKYILMTRYIKSKFTLVDLLWPEQNINRSAKAFD